MEDPTHINSLRAAARRPIPGLSSVSRFPMGCPSIRTVSFPGRRDHPDRTERLSVHRKSHRQHPCIRVQESNHRAGQLAFLHAVGLHPGSFGGAAGHLAIASFVARRAVIDRNCDRSASARDDGRHTERDDHQDPDNCRNVLSGNQREGRARAIGYIQLDDRGGGKRLEWQWNRRRVDRRWWVVERQRFDEQRRIIRWRRISRSRPPDRASRGHVAFAEDPRTRLRSDPI